jgi:hypothetical protein
MAAVTVVATFALVGAVTVVVVTLANGRPMPGVNALLVPAIVLGIVGGAWARHAIRSTDPPASSGGRSGSAFVNRFTNPRAWSGVPRFARWILGSIAIGLFLVAASSNPSYGGTHNNPSLPLCASGRVIGSACASRVLHLHALAAHQRFFAAIFAGYFTLVIGVALSRWRSNRASVESLHAQV